MTSLSDPGLGRALDSLDNKIDALSRDFKSLDAKVDGFIMTSVSKQEFQAYQELRRTAARWAAATIISVLVLGTSIVATLLSTHP